MPSSDHVVRISATEFPQFVRLVEFAQQVDDYAEETDDYALKALVDECREDLLRAGGG